MIYKSECWSIVTGDTRFNFDWSGTMELSLTLQLSPMFHPLSFPIQPQYTLTSRAVRKIWLWNAGDPLKVILASIAEMCSTKAEEHSNWTAVAALVLQEICPMLWTHLRSIKSEERWSVGVWRNLVGNKTHCLQNVLIKNSSYLVNSLNVVLTLLFADRKTSCKTKNRDRTPTVFLLGKRTLEDAIVTLFWSGRLSQMNEQ